MMGVGFYVSIMNLLNEFKEIGVGRLFVCYCGYVVGFFWCKGCMILFIVIYDILDICFLF